MYKIIGADGKEYGPITVEQLKQWLTEGRVNAQTQVLAEGTADWSPLSEFPELITAAVPSSAIPGPAFQPGGVVATDQVKGPAMGLIVTAILGFVLQLFALVINVLGVSIGSIQSGRNEAWVNLFSGSIGIMSCVLTMAVAGLILYGAMKMKKLERYGWAITASIFALVPCVSPCCLVGAPFGIWALVVLSKPEVKSAFH
jgi:hypothetical protein